MSILAKLKRGLALEKSSDNARGIQPVIDAHLSPHLTVDYRPDIDGLRAIAVVSVLLFHAFPEKFPGGFTGVDVFFVISGFLISGAISKTIRQNTFSYADFYGRRVKRIFPALIVVLVSCLFIGWHTLFTAEFKQFGKHVFAGVSFVQNLVLWEESNYFDRSSEVKPLLHLWSLSVEEQFYLIWPVVLYAAVKWRKVRLFMWTTLAVSFAINIALISKELSAAAFYSPFSRFWEICLGAILAEYSQFLSGNPTLRRYSGILSLIGLTFICAAFVLTPNAGNFPGWWALLPTLGATFVIASGDKSVVNRNVLSNRLMIFIGLCSYPLYLWHWPLLSFARILSHETPTPEIRIWILVLSFVLAWLTYEYFEKPIRFSKAISNPKKIFLLSALTIVIGLSGLAIVINNGVSSRQFVESNPGLESGNDGGTGGYLTNGCGLNPNEEKLFYECKHDRRWEPKLALIGDSKAGVLLSGLVRKSDASSGVLVAGGNGPNQGASVAAISNERIYKTSQVLTPLSIEAVRKHQTVKVVIIATATRSLFDLPSDNTIKDLPSNKNFDLAFTAFNEVVTRLVTAGKKVVIVVDNPTLSDPSDCLPRRTGLNVVDKLFKTTTFTQCSITYSQHMTYSKLYRELIEKIRRQHPGKVAIFDTLPILCDLKSSSCSMYSNGRMMYSFSDHISDYAAGLISEELIPFAKEFAEL